MLWFSYSHLTNLTLIGYSRALRTRSDMCGIFDENFRNAHFDQIRGPEFQEKKQQFLFAVEIITHRNLPLSSRAGLDVAIVSGKAQNALKALLAETRKNRKSDFSSGVFTNISDMMWGSSQSPSPTYRHAIRKAGQHQDRYFLANILGEKYSALLPQSVVLINRLAISWLLGKISHCAETISHKINAQNITDWKAANSRARRTEDQKELSKSLMRLKNDINLEVYKHSAKCVN